MFKIKSRLGLFILAVFCLILVIYLLSCGGGGGNKKTTTDPCSGVNCGSNATCSGGNCICNSVYGNCDNSWTNGCEVSLKTDSNNCNSCGSKCSLGQSCSNGQCIITDLCVGINCGSNATCSSGNCSCNSNYDNCDSFWT